VRWGRRVALWLYDRGALRYLPWRFLKVYVYPLTVRGQRRAHDPKSHFDRYYDAFPEGEVTDMQTIGANTRRIHARYH